MLVPSWDQPRRHRGFKVGRRQVAQGRVQPLPIVDLLDEAADRAARLLGGPVRAPIDLFALQRAHEALRLGVVVRGADPAHARLDAVVLASVLPRRTFTCFSVSLQGAPHTVTRTAWRCATTWGASTSSVRGRSVSAGE